MELDPCQIKEEGLLRKEKFAYRCGWARYITTRKASYATAHLAVWITNKQTVKLPTQIA